MQDSGHGNGRTNKGRFAPGASGNPRGRAGKELEVRSDGAFDNLPGQQVNPDIVGNMLRMDGWANATTGVGVPGFDKRLNTTFRTDIFSYNDLVELWRGDDICARVIETLPKEALKKGYELNISDEADYGDLKDQIEQAVDDLEINDTLRTALMFERAYGGAVLLIGANDGQDMAMPLNLDAVTELMYVTPLEPLEIIPLKSYTDQGSPKYGKPELYQLNAIAHGPTIGMVDPMSRCLPTTSVIHESRLIVFPGRRVSKFQGRSSVAGVHWGDSVLSRVVRVIADFNLGYASTGIMLTEQGLPVFSMKELAKLVNANRLDIVKARMSLLFQQMSTARAAVIDTEESYERKAMPLQGLPDILDRLATRVAAAVEMPVTKLMGQSPKGLGNEGDSDMAQWYDCVSGYQDEKLRRPLRRLLQVVMRAMGVTEPAKWSIKFHPLMQLTDKEMADARNLQMTIDTGYTQAGILTVDEIRKSRWSGDYSYETQLDNEAWAAINAADAPALTPEDMMAMGLDPNNPDDVAQAQQMQAEQAGGQIDPATGMPVQPEVDPETGEPVAPEGEIDPETGEPKPQVDPETGEALPPAAKIPLAPPEGSPGSKPGLGAPPAVPGAKPPVPGGKALPGAKPALPGAKPPVPGAPGAKPPVPGAKPALPGAKPVPGAKPPLPGAKPPVDGETPPDGEAKPLPFGKKAAKPADGEAPPELDENGDPVDPQPADGEAPPEGDQPELDENGKPIDPELNGEHVQQLAKAMAHQPAGGGGRSGLTEEDRQRMSSQRPGQPLHLIDKDKNGKVSEQEAQEAGMSLEDIMAQIDALHQEINAGGKTPAVKPDPSGEVSIEDVPEEADPAENAPAEGEPKKPFPAKPAAPGDKPKPKNGPFGPPKKPKFGSWK